MAFEETLPWRRFSLRVNFSDIPILPQLLAKVPAAHVARLRRGLGCIWPHMLWLTPGLHTEAVDADPTVRAARNFDAFETTMRTLRLRLKPAQPGGAGGGGGVGLADDSWRAAVDSCTVDAGDGAELELDALRRQVHSEGVHLSQDAADIDAIIREWQRTRDDKTFAMKTVRACATRNGHA